MTSFAVAECKAFSYWLLIDQFNVNVQKHNKETPPPTVLFQTIQFSISTQFNCKITFLFQAIQFSPAVLIQPQFCLV